MVYFKQDKKMSDMEKSNYFHLVIVPANHVVTMIECFIMKAVPQRSQPFFCVLYIPNLNISNVTRRQCRDTSVTVSENMVGSEVKLKYELM